MLARRLSRSRLLDRRCGGHERPTAVIGASGSASGIRQIPTRPPSGLGRQAFSDLSVDSVKIHIEHVYGHGDDDGGENIIEHTLQMAKPRG